MALGKRDDLHDAMLITKLATSLWSGLDGAEGNAAARGNSWGQEAELNRIRDLVRTGVPPSSALALCRKELAGRQAYEMVRAAEESGDPRSSLVQASKVLEESSLRRKSTAAALTYPLIIMAALGSAAVFLALAVGPHLLDSYAAFSLQPPRGLRAAVTAAAALRTAAGYIAGTPWTWPVLVAATCSTACWIRRWRGLGRETWERLAWSVPLIGSAARQRAACDFFRRLAGCLSLGVPVEIAFSSAGRSCGSPYAKIRSIALAPFISEGVPLDAVFDKMSWLPPELRETMSRAADSGQWREMVERSAAILERLADVQERVGYSLLEPLLVACLGAGVLVLALTFVVPISGLAVEVAKL